jgi:hypothetical protein
MPVNPDSARDSGYFIYLVTVELGLEVVQWMGGEYLMKG